MSVCTYRLGGHIIEQIYSKIMGEWKDERGGKRVRKHEV